MNTQTDTNGGVHPEKRTTQDRPNQKPTCLKKPWRRPTLTRIEVKRTSRGAGALTDGGTPEQGS